MEQQHAYPLSWPAGRPRTDRNRITHARFGERSIAAAVDEVLRQLNLMNAREIVISTNLTLRADGLPKSNQAQPADRGVAVYFKLRTGYDQQAKREIVVDRVISCDRWLLVEDNMWAIAKDIDATRGKLRWGASTVEQAFAGYAALPPAGVSQSPVWWQVLGFDSAYMPSKTSCMTSCSATGGASTALHMPTAHASASKACGCHPTSKCCPC